jgi:signal transduction histidine kinase
MKRTDTVGSRRRSGFPMQVVLGLGFGGLLLLLAFSGIDALAVLGQIQHRNSVIRDEFVERSRSLERIRALLYVSGTLVRDDLLEPDPRKAEASRASLAGTRKEITTRLGSYRKLLEPQEREPFRVLEEEISAYWRRLDPVLAWDDRQRHDQGFPFLRDVVFPRRTGMLALADRVAGVNEQQLELGERRLLELFGAFRKRLLLMLAATLGLGLLLAGGSIRRILVLESETESHLAALESARGELQELSARLLAAQEGERKMLSRELHDSVGQPLSAALMELRNVAATLPGDAPPTVGAHITTSRVLLEETLNLVRNLALMLRPSMLDDLGLVPALQWQAREMARRTGIDVQVAAEVADDLPEETKTCIYRVVQEALTNCAKHAGAQRVWISLRTTPSGIRLVVQDDGRGFGSGRERGMGLLGAEERVSHIGGRFEVNTEPGRGTRLSVELPIESSASAVASEPEYAEPQR